MHTMKRLIASSILFLCISHAHSQFKLDFCASVDKNGYCLFNNNRFILSPDSTTQRIWLEVINPDGFKGLSKIKFKIYSFEKSGEEKYDNTVEQPVQPEWVSAWVPYLFKSAGKYEVKIYNDLDELMCSKSMEVLN